MNAPFTPSDDSASQRENPGLPSMAERSAVMADVTTRLDAHVPLPRPAPVRSADDAVRSVMPGLLTKEQLELIDKGLRQFNRENRNG